MKAIHNSSKSELVFREPDKQPDNDAKPYGLWYGVDDAWADWCRSEMPDWLKPNNFIIEIDYAKMIRITTESDLLLFTEEYGVENPWPRKTYISWPTVAKEYSGIEISPYRWDCRLNVPWYYGWDCASGCIWKSDAIKSIEKEGD